jgi:hypothetical protein
MSVAALSSPLFTFAGFGNKAIALSPYFIWSLVVGLGEVVIKTVK